MTLREDRALLRLFLPECAVFDGQDAWRAVIEYLRLSGVAGATAYRGRAGFTARGPISTDAIEVLSGDLPVVIEAVDRPERIEAVVENVRAMAGSRALMTVEKVEALIEHGGTTA